MTISNVSCDNITGSSVGGMGGELETMNPLILDRLFNRYLGPVDSASGPGEKAKLLYHIVYCTGLPGEGSCSGDGNEAAAVMEDGVSTIIVPRGKVYVYDLRNYSGDKTITHNIRYADEAYSGISELPQAIIVSGDLTIAANVTNIDAWIITMYTGQEDGLLSTCPDDPADATTCDKPLTVNGPVYASSVKLNRTYGAFGGSKTCNSITSGGGSYVYAQDSYCSSVSSDGLGFRGSIAPAERFILRPDTFLWTYAQAQIVPKATSVYTYEPSPSF
jgi:hypothetical protein